MQRLLIIYSGYLGILVGWFVIGILAGWVLRKEGMFAIPEWASDETLLNNLTMFGICLLPHYLLGFGVLSALVNFLSEKLALAFAILPYILTAITVSLFVYSMLKPRQATDYLKKVYEDPKDQKIVSAIFKHDTETVKKFIDAGNDINSIRSTAYKKTPMMYAAAYCDTETIEFLLKLGVSPNTPQDIEDNTSALTELWREAYLSSGNNECLRKNTDLLINAGADVDSFREKLFKFVVKSNRSPEFLKYFIDGISKEELEWEIKFTKKYGPKEMHKALLDYQAKQPK